MNHFDNHFRFAFADAVIVKEKPLVVLLGKVTCDNSVSEVSVALRKEEDGYYLDFAFPPVDTETSFSSEHPVANAAITSYVIDTVANALELVDTVLQDVGRPPVLALTESDTAPDLLPNRFYTFPTMTELTPTLLAPDASVPNVMCEHRFRFTSGETPTVLTLPESVIGAFTPEPNRTYEVSIVDGYLLYNSWEV